MCVSEEFNRKHSPPTEEGNPSTAKTIGVNQIRRLLYLMEFGVGSEMHMRVANQMTDRGEGPCPVQTGNKPVFHA